MPCGCQEEDRLAIYNIFETVISHKHIFWTTISSIEKSIIERVWCKFLVVKFTTTLTTWFFYETKQNMSSLTTNN